MNSPNTNVDPNTNTNTNTNPNTVVDPNTNTVVDLNINITRNSVSTKLRHNFKPNTGSNKRSVETSHPTPTKVENFEQVPMFDRWADGI